MREYLKYRQALEILLLEDRQDTYTHQRFAAETGHLFALVSKDEHEELWIHKTGLDTLLRINRSSLVLLIFLSIVPHLDPNGVVMDRIKRLVEPFISEEKESETRANTSFKRDENLLNFLSVMLDKPDNLPWLIQVNYPDSNLLKLTSPIIKRIRTKFLSHRLQSPKYEISDLSLWTPEILVDVLRYILFHSLHNSNEGLTEIPPRYERCKNLYAKSNPEFRVLDALFCGRLDSLKFELRNNNNNKSFEDAFQYLKVYNVQNDLGPQLLDFFMNPLTINDGDCKNKLKIVTKFVHHGKDLCPKFTAQRLFDLLREFRHEDVNQVPIRDLETLEDSRYLVCLLEATLNFYADRSTSSELMKLTAIEMEHLVVSSRTNVNHKVAAFEVMILLAEYYHVSEILWDFIVSYNNNRRWETLDASLGLLAESLLKRGVDFSIPSSLTQFLVFTLCHENSFVRSSAISTLTALKAVDKDLFFIVLRDKSIVEFLKHIFTEETEAIVRRKAALLATSFDFMVETDDFRKLMSDALYDWDWEFKDIVLSAWEKLTLKCLSETEPMRALYRNKVLDALFVAMGDHEKRLKQRLVPYLKLVKTVIDEDFPEKCLGNANVSIAQFLKVLDDFVEKESASTFDDYVENVSGLEGLLSDILQTKEESYKTFDVDCF